MATFVSALKSRSGTASMARFASSTASGFSTVSRIPIGFFSPTTFSRPPNPVTGGARFNTRMLLGDFDLTLLPKHDRIRFNVGYSPERLSGPAFTNYHAGGNEFNFQSELVSRANDFRVGADGKLGPVDFSFLQGFRRFREDSFINVGPTPGINL